MPTASSLLFITVSGILTQSAGPIQQGTVTPALDFFIIIVLGGLALLGVALAIIARRDEALRNSQIRLSALVDSALDAILTIDQSGTIQSCNPAGERLFGYDRGALVGKPIETLMPSPYREEHQRYVANYLATGNAKIIGRERELIGLRKDGTVFPIMLAVTEFRIGRERYFTGIVSDITERKHVEQAELDRRALAEVMRDTASTLNSTLDVNVVVDSMLSLVERVVPHDDANIILLDQTGAGWTLVAKAGPFNRTTGIVPPSMETDLTLALRANATLLIPDVAAAPVWSRMAERGNSMSYLGAALRHGGHTIGFINLASLTPGHFTEVHANHLEIFANEAAAALENARLYDELEKFNTLMVRTVEERTAQLQNAKERVEGVLNNSPDAILLLDEAGIIQTSNPAFVSLFGYDIDRLYGQKPLFLFTGMSTRDWNRQKRKVARTGEQSRFEAVARNKSGTDFDVEVALAPIRGESGLKGLVCSVRDIRALKHVQRMKDAFVSNVSHELRTPVTSFKLFLRLLQRVPPEQHKSIIDTLVRESDRLNNIINDVLNLSRLDQGTTVLNREPADLNAIVEPLIADREMLASTRGVWLTKELAPNLPSTMIDAGLISQALNVLLTNALNYTQASGKIEVRTFLEHVDRRRWVVLSVSDTGPGITEDDRLFLFERFYRGQAGRESTAPGSGLGLSIAKEIMDRHEGKITVESAGIPGQGSTFKLWFPVARSRRAASDEPASRAAGYRPRKHRRSGDKDE